MSIRDPHAKGNYTLAVKKTIIGSKVVNRAMEDLGEIEDIVIDSRNDRVAYAILSFHAVLGLGGKHFAVPWEAMQYDANEQRATLDIDKERLEKAPGFDKDDWPDMSRSEWLGRVDKSYP
jgi:PRC-barrel domain